MSLIKRRLFSIVSTTTLMAAVLIGIGVDPASAVPAAPTNVVASAPTDTTVILDWDVDADADSYKVTSSPAAVENVELESGDSVTGLSPSTTYTFTVVAVDATGDSTPSAPSDPITTTGPPSAPQNLVEDSKTSDSIVVSWDAPAEPGNPAVTGYDATATAGGAPVAGAVTGTTATFSGLTASTTYTISVIATNGASSPPATRSVTTEAAPADPGPPTNVQFGTVTETTIALSWTAPADLGSPEITEYVVTFNGQEKRVPSAQTSTVLPDLAPGTSYAISVRSTNGDADSAETSAGSVTTKQAPGSFAVTASAVTATTATISWTNPGGSPAPDYAVSIAPNVGVNITDPGTPRSRELTGLTAGTTYTVTVTASNDVGTPTQDSSTFTANAAPNAVTNVSSEILFDPVRVELSWQAAETTGTPIVSYTIEQQSGPTGLEDIVLPVAELSAVDGRYTYVIETTLDRGDYRFAVFASSAAGNGPAGQSGTVSVPTNPGPTSITAVNVTPIGGGQYSPLPFNNYVTITWEPPEDTGGEAITHYNVTMAGLEVNDIPASARTATIGPLGAGTYTASIQAFTAVGAGPVGNSNQVEVRSFAPFISRASFIRQQYRDFLGRSAETAGLNYWLTQTDTNGSNVEDVIARFMASPEFSPRRAVVRLYGAYFPNRDMDLGGFDFWSQRIASGRASVESVSQFFATSDEFGRTYGALNDSDFVTLVYQNVLGRDPDAGGFAYWQQRLAAGLDRGTLMTMFSESPENVRATSAHVDVVVTYRGMLNRLPDDEGRDFWVGRIESDPNALKTLIRGFFVTSEYANRVTP